MSTATDSPEAWIHSWLPRESLRDPASAVAGLARRWSERHRYWHGVGHLRCLVDAIKAESPSAARSALLLTALYPGSFNPFHLGHLSILRQAEKAFDKIILAVGINRQKPGAGARYIPTLERIYHTVPPSTSEESI